VERLGEEIELVRVECLKKYKQKEEEIFLENQNLMEENIRKIKENQLILEKL